jgi:hypothetical protein
MSDTLELPIPHHKGGRILRVRVLHAGDGWNVVADVDGEEVAREYCSNWQRVERLRQRLQRELDQPPDGKIHRHLRRAAAAVLLIGALTASLAGAQPVDDMNARFQTAVAEYMTLRDQARQGVAREHIIDPYIRDISSSLLAARIGQLRRSATVGDLIPADLADTIRDRIHRAFDPTEVDVMLMNLYPDGLPTDPVRLHAHYDQQNATPPPVSVLAALPPVPGVLGYRLIGRDLVLWDEEAEIVLDAIAGALPEPRIWKFLDVSSIALRQQIGDALRNADLDGRELVAEMARDGDPAAAPPMIDHPFDWRAGTVMPPSVLHALPRLPSPLEYRFVGTDLVVIDVRNGCVRGILPNVLPKPLTERTVTDC